jgi:hypothetical protein
MEAVRTARSMRDAYGIKPNLKPDMFVVAKNATMRQVMRGGWGLTTGRS